MRHPTLSILLPLGAFAAALSAQATWIVGPSGFPDLTSAYAAAQPGDLILVQQNSSFAQLSGKGVRIVSSGARRTLQVTSSAAAAATIDSIPSGQALALIGFDLVPVGAAPSQPVGLAVQGCTGTVVWENCAFLANSSAQRFAVPLFVQGCAYCRFDSCVLEGQNASLSGCVPGTDGLVVDTSVVELWSTTVVGGDDALGAPCAGYLPGGSGLRATASTVTSLPYTPHAGSSMGVAADWWLVGSTVCTVGACTVFGAGALQSFGGPSPVNLGGASIVHSGTSLPVVTAQATATGFAAQVTPLGANGVGLFVLGSGGAVAAAPLPLQGIPMIDLASPWDVALTTTGTWTVNLAPALLQLLAGTTWQVTAAEWTTFGVLRFGNGATLRF